MRKTALKTVHLKIKAAVSRCCGNGHWWGAAKGCRLVKFQHLFRACGMRWLTVGVAMCLVGIVP